MEIQLPPTPISPNVPLPSRPPPTSGFSSATQLVGSDDENEGEDLFPDTSVPITRHSHGDPTLVPLPPSPVVKPSIPSRKPKGWISTLPSTDSDHSSTVELNARSSSNEGRKGSSGRRVSARLPSGPSPLRIGGRTISGVMQYAMHQDTMSHHEGTSPILDATNEKQGDVSVEHRLEPLDTRDGRAHQAVDDVDDTSGSGPTTISDEVNEEESSMEEIRNSVIGLTDQDQDEVWMQYVRNQLGTLFPDFFHESTTTDTVEQANSVIQSGSHGRPDVSGWTQGGQIDGGGVPNVREEIHGLKDEIERLRGVVGGLAEGLHRGGVIRSQQVVSVEEISAETQGDEQADGNRDEQVADDQTDDAHGVDRGPGAEAVPDAFIKVSEPGQNDGID